MVRPPLLPTDLVARAPGHVDHSNAIHAYLRTLPYTIAAIALTKRVVTASYTLVAADAENCILHCVAEAPVTITLPDSLAATIPVETVIPWRAYGAGAVTFVASTGATVVSRGSVFTSAGRYAEGVVTKVSSNTWLLSGDLTA